MFSRLRALPRVPSPAMAMAFVSLVIAVGGVAYAAIPSETGKFNACYAKNEGLLLGIFHAKGQVRLVQPGEACRSYETATSWGKGISGVHEISKSVYTPDQVADALIECPAGEIAISGGFSVADPARLSSSRSTGTGWSVRLVFEQAPPADSVWEVLMHATCARVN